MFERSIEIKPNYGAYSNLGILYYQERRYADAARMYEKALDLGDYDYLVWGNLALAYQRIPGESEKALEKFEENILRTFDNSDEVIWHDGNIMLVLHKRI